MNNKRIKKGDIIYCPLCGKSEYSTSGRVISTLALYRPIIKNGININPDKNSKKQDRICHGCGHRKFIIQINPNREDYLQEL